MPEADGRTPDWRTPDWRAVDWRAVDWRAHERTVQVGGARIAYADLGRGEPAVLFVHGLGAQWRVWLANLPTVAAARRVLAVDLPGFGDSEADGESASIRRYAELLDELCERVGLGPIIVVGNSMGGFVAAELALIRPERVKALVLVDAAGIVPTRRERWHTMPLMRSLGIIGARVAAAARPIAARPRLRTLVLSALVHDPRSLPPDLVYFGMLAPPGPSTGAALAASVSYLSHDWGEELRGIRCPALIAWGEGDTLIPVRHAREYARLIPGARVVTIAAAGHLPMLEQPELFNAALLEFIEALEEEESGPATVQSVRIA